MGKKPTSLIKTIIAFALTLMACASELKKQSGFLNNYQKNMVPGAEGGAKLRWPAPGVDFGKYNKVMLDSVIFYLADDSDYKGIDPIELKDLADACNLAIVWWCEKHTKTGGKTNESDHRWRSGRRGVMRGAFAQIE